MPQTPELNSSLLQQQGWNTNPENKGQENHRLLRQDEVPVQAAIHPNFCVEKTGTAMAKDTDGFVKPARAFASVADFMKGFIGFNPYPLNPEGTQDGSANNCTGPACPSCESIVPCGLVRYDVKEPGVYCVGQMFKLCADPALTGDLAGNLGDCLVEPTDDPAESIGAVEKFEGSFTCDENGVWSMGGAVSTVLLRAGVNIKAGIVNAVPNPAPATEEGEEAEG